jgi:hypothetical protein
VGAGWSVGRSTGGVEKDAIQGREGRVFARSEFGGSGHGFRWLGSRLPERPSCAKTPVRRPEQQEEWRRPYERETRWKRRWGWEGRAAAAAAAAAAAEPSSSLRPVTRRVTPTVRRLPPGITAVVGRCLPSHAAVILLLLLPMLPLLTARTTATPARTTLLRLTRGSVGRPLSRPTAPPLPPMALVVRDPLCPKPLRARKLMSA